MWRVKDGKQMATVEAMGVLCLAVSKDGKWIAAGTGYGDVIVWDAKTYEEIISQSKDYCIINAVDFSPDSTSLVSASDNGTASIWDIATRKRVHTFRHGDRVRAAKYSPQGGRIATATDNSVRVWDSNDGRFKLLVDIKVTVTPWFNNGLLWFGNSLFVVSGEKIKRIDASTGSAISEWPVADGMGFLRIALPKHGKFIAYSTRRTVTFWDTATHTQLGLIQHPEDIRSIAVSPDDRFLAIAGRQGNITINSLSRIIVSILSINNLLVPIIYPCDSIPLSHIHPTFQEPDSDIRIGDAALHSWQHNPFANAQALRERAKATLACGEWKDALVVATSVSVSSCSPRAGAPRGIDTMVCSSHFPGS